MRIQAISDDALAGSFSGLISRLVAAPLDVIKIRWQLQFGQSEQYQHRSIWHELKRIVDEEGPRALWKGNLSASYLWVTYMAVQFSVYGIVNRHLAESNRLQDGVTITRTTKTASNFIAGASAATIASVATYPFDIMRTQFVMQGEPKVFPTMVSFIQQTHRSRGLSGLFAGVTPAVVGIVPYMGLNFTFFEYFKESLAKVSVSSSIIEQSWVGKSFEKGLAGGAAGGISKLLVYPLDTVKKRLQMQVLLNTVDKTSVVPKYSGILNCLVKTFASEGLAGLYKGLAPTVLKAVVSSGLTFATFETTKDAVAAMRSISKS